MAGDWIPIDVTLPRKPEVLKIASLTGLSRRAVVGALIEIWGWAQAETVDGHVDADVDAVVGALEAHERPESSVIRAMVKVGWLEDHGDYIVFPKAEKWLTTGAKARLQKTLRQRAWRNSKPESGPNVDGPVDGNVDAAPSTTEEKRREEKSIKGNTPLSPEGETKPKELIGGVTTKRRNVIPPNRQDVIAYAATQGLPESEVDAFMDHYIANGWKTRSGRMQDWEAGLRNWKRSPYRKENRNDHRSTSRTARECLEPASAVRVEEITG